MARKVTVERTCDVCGDTVAAAFSAEVGLDGRRFHTDLCPRHELAFRLAITPFLRNVVPSHLAESCRRPRARRRH